jgi:8-oxo-dGTP diphosphatase
MDTVDGQTAQSVAAHLAAAHLVAWLLLQDEQGRVLLARRAGGYAAGQWGLPGGHVHDHETLAQAAARETQEEVGVQATRLQPLGVTRYAEAGLRGVDFYFVTRHWTGTPYPRSECSEVGWFAPQALPPDTLPWLAGVLAAHLGGAWLHDLPDSERRI